MRLFRDCSYRIPCKLLFSISYNTKRNQPEFLQTCFPEQLLISFSTKIGFDGGDLGRKKILLTTLSVKGLCQLCALEL